MVRVGSTSMILIPVALISQFPAHHEPLKQPLEDGNKQGDNVTLQEQSIFIFDVQQVHELVEYIWRVISCR